MNYSVLYIRLDSYASHRNKKGDEIAEEDLERATKKEVITTVAFTIAILAFPLTIIILLVLKKSDFNGDVIYMWGRYELFYVVNIVFITILLVLSTTLALRHMRKVFG